MRWRGHSPTLVLATLGLIGCAHGPGGPAETLVVFLGDDSSFATTDLRRNHLGEIEAVAAELQVPVVMRTLDDGAPPDVRITPLMVYQNRLGRSIYQGRYADTDRLRHFVRTSRFVPQSDSAQTRRSIPAWTAGRSTIATPLKITSLGGEVPPGFEQAAFERESGNAIAAGMQRFEIRSDVTIGRSDRMFYLDFHPYVAGGMLFLSCEMYSQFNCHEPIYSALDEPIIGPWEQRAEIFAEAGALLEKELIRQMTASPRGDAFAPIASEIAVADWADLGLELPEAAGPALTDVRVTDAEVPVRWVIDRAASVDPAVLFRFAPPMDNMTGEVETLDAHLSLSPDAGGVFTLEVAALTMGNELLDEAIQSSLVLDVATHPTSSFRVEAIDGDSDEPLRFGELRQATMRGVFDMKGISIPLDVRTTLEPVLDGQGQPRLILTADWALRLMQPFNLQGPDGPYPANDTILLRCRITMRPDHTEKEATP